MNIIKDLRMYYVYKKKLNMFLIHIKLQASNLVSTKKKSISYLIYNIVDEILVSKM